MTVNVHAVSVRPGVRAGNGTPSETHPAALSLADLTAVKARYGRSLFIKLARFAYRASIELRDAADELDDPQIQAIVQVGSNLAMARVAAMGEFWLDIPVIAVNTATYWRALRRSGIKDKVFGFGTLLKEF